MSDRLKALRAERDALEQAGTYEGPVYEWLITEIETLEAAEPAKPPAPAPKSTPRGDVAHRAAGRLGVGDARGGAAPRALERPAASRPGGPGQRRRLGVRYAAAAELARRGELADDVAARLLVEANGMAREAAEAGPLDPERLAEGPMRELATRLRNQVATDEAELRGRVDPRDQMVTEVNALIREASEARAREPLAGVGAATTEPTEGSPSQEA
jgi:hypothetical protein